MSQWHEKEKVKERNVREKQLREAAEYCIENKVKGYAALSTGLFPLIKDPRTINRRIADMPGKKKLITGQEKSYCKMLTEQEEKTLVKYLINRNRCRQGVSEKEAEGIVLNILRTREAVNTKGGRKFIALSGVAKACLQKKTFNTRKFFERLKANYPELKSKKKHKVSLKRGIRCTREMAIEHLAELAGVLIDTGIAPGLKQIEPGVWRGDIDTSRIYAHDETPQFINYSKSGASRSKVFAGCGEDCDELTKEKRECVTVHPFGNLKGDHALCQVIFSGSGHSMCPKTATDKIPNLLISVNDSGCTDHNTLNAAYTELNQQVQERQQEKPIVIIADGHKSRFGSDVMKTCEETKMEQYLIPPDTSGSTQFHDQVNQRLHDKYEEKKSELYSGFSDINKEAFMTILGEIWSEWVTPAQLVKAAKRVGISDSGLDVNWMDQSKFEAAEAILNPPDLTKTPQKQRLMNSTVIESPEDVRKGSAEYYRRKYDKSLEYINNLSQTTPDLEEVPGLMPYKRINTDKSKNKFVTKMHGSLKATEVRKLVTEREKVEEEAKQRKEEKQRKREEMKKAFNLCRLKCQCKEACEALHLKECSVCFHVLKTQCHKKDCKNLDGKLPRMISVAAKKLKPSKSLKRKLTWNGSDSEESDDADEINMEISEEDSDDDDYDCNYESSTGETTKMKKKRKTYQTIIEESQQSLDDDQVGKFYCVYFDDKRYWGKLLKVFSEDVDEPANMVEMKFLHYKFNKLWDYPRKEDKQMIEAKYIFLGPVIPIYTGKDGYKFDEDEQSLSIYKQIRNM